MLARLIDQYETASEAHRRSRQRIVSDDTGFADLGSQSFNVVDIGNRNSGQVFEKVLDS